MAPRRQCLALLLVLILVLSLCHAQNNPGDRQPAVAGQFYPDKPGELRQMLISLGAKGKASMGLKNIAAIVVPHAGYVYSGSIAASGYNQVDRTKQYENIFIIGPSHRTGFEGAAVYTAGNFLTPLGSVEVNCELGEQLIGKSSIFSNRRDAQEFEHSIEVQLPFLQQIIKKPFRIVPIVVGAQEPATCRTLGETLRPFFNDRNLFVISTDFSHYPTYDDAVRIDRMTASAIMSNSPDSLLHTMERTGRLGTPDLATSLCGWGGVLTFLFMTAPLNDVHFTAVEYKNSGDSPAGDRGRVVGYWAIAVTRQPSPGGRQFELSDKERKALLSLARRTIEQYLTKGRMPETVPSALPTALTTPCGAFVTLYKHSSLRGCIGSFEATAPLYKVVQEMAVASATQDYRFTPVDSSEVRDLRIEISVLTPKRRIASINEFQLGKHGIYIKKGNRSGTFLPQVAKETGWTKEEFLGHCALDKAGIGWDGWKDAELYVYEALVFGE
jgi:AmmeMemoRadiSam system protein B/AmmeMemoRadiSam system protein A